VCCVCLCGSVDSFAVEAAVLQWIYRPASMAVGTAAWQKARWWVQKQGARVPLACEAGRGRYSARSMHVSLTGGAGWCMDPASVCMHVGTCQ
jgi:hypothetical protein